MKGTTEKKKLKIPKFKKALKIKIKKNISLKNHTTFKIGGRAKYFLEVKNTHQLIEGLRWVKKNNLPFFILGGGSNILVSDKGFSGIVIKIKNTCLPQIKTSKNLKTFQVQVKAGVSFQDFLEFLVKKRLTGLEWAAGIPGTIGGAVRGNIGAFGNSIKDVLKEVEVFDFLKFKIKRLNLKKCNFWEKGGIFKKNKNLIILSAIFELYPFKKKEIKKKINFYLDYRKKNHPTFPSAGCIFKNFLGKIKDKKLLEQFPKLREFNQKREIPAGFLIEKTGLKGKRIGKAEISKKHANFIINLGKAKAEDVLKLINLTEKKVKEKFGVELEKEIEYLPFG